MAARTGGDSQVSGGPVSPGWCFSATGWKSAKDRDESVGEIDFVTMSAPTIIKDGRTRIITLIQTPAVLAVLLLALKSQGGLPAGVGHPACSCEGKAFPNRNKDRVLLELSPAKYKVSVAGM